MTTGRLLALSLSALLLAAGGQAGASTLRVNMQNDVDSADPGLDYLSTGWQIQYLTCAKLVNYPDLPAPLGSELVPDAAATLPKVSRDGRTYTFTVRRKVRFATGETVNAATFKHTLERLLTPSLASPAQPFYTDIVGAQEMLAGDATTLSGVTASRRKLTIRLTAPHADFLARLAMPFACAVPRATP